MGQAKQRGSREQRIAEAIEREAEHQRKRQEYFEMRQNQMREESLQEEKPKETIVAGSGSRRTFPKPLMLAAALCAIGAGLNP